MQNSSSLAKGCKSVEDIQEKLKNLFKNTLKEILKPAI
ncbi:hypothetical protein UF75_4836 [Desulfosporosinus sp. I2]|nr:hypothetical protein UF75_4836 [Desulfosporosinus sp. I2]